MNDMQEIIQKLNKNLIFSMKIKYTTQIDLLNPIIIIIIVIITNNIAIIIITVIIIIINKKKDN